MTIWINNIGFNSVTELSAKRELRRTDIRYNTQGGSSIRRNGKKRRLSRRFRLSGELVRGTSFGTGTAGGLQRTVRQMAV